jgi:hypothetical protein
MDSEFSTPPERKPLNTSPNRQRNLKVVGVIVITLLVLAGIATGVFAFLATNNDASNTAQVEQQSFNRIRNDVDKTTDYVEDDAKQPVKFGYFDVTLNNVVRGYVPQDGSVPRDNSEYLLINLTISNPDSKVHLLSSLDLAILTADDRLFNSAFVRVDPMIDTIRIEPGATVEGNVIFDIPTNAQGLKLYYNTQIYNEEAQKLERLEYSILLQDE